MAARSDVGAGSLSVPLPADMGEVMLYAERALYWPAGATLFLADPHFGKAAAFYAAGMAVPAVTAPDLERLSALIRATNAARLVVLGDFFHTRHSHAPHTLDALDRWRQEHPALEIVLVRGNHDRHAGEPPPALEIVTVDPPYRIPPFLCCHAPADAPALSAETRDDYILAGHLHPQAVLHDVDGSTVRLPCFLLGRQQAILPAFGSFTGGQTIRPRAGDRLFVIAGDGVYPVKTRYAR